jgi:hypothetical protein
MIKILSFSCLLCFIASPRAELAYAAPPARAAVILRMKQQYMSQQTQSCEVTASLDSTRFRTDTDCGPGFMKNMSIIVIRSEQKLIMISPEKKTYYETSEKALEQLQKDPMAALEKDPKYAAQMAKMSPEQKAMMKKMMSGAMTKTMNMKAELKALGTSKKVGSWSCRSYGVFNEKRMIEELCLADRGQFPSLAPMLDSWKDFQSHWLKMARSPSLQAHEKANQIGIAVETLIYGAEGLKSRIDLESVTSESRPDSYFQPPAGFTKAASPILN